MPRRARRARRAGARRRRPPVDASEPVHRPQLRGSRDPRGGGARRRAAGRPARRDGRRTGGGVRAARRRRHRRVRDGARALRARPRDALGPRAGAAGDRERRPHLRAVPRHGPAPPHGAQGRLGHPAPPLQRPGRHPGPRGARARALHLARRRGPEDPLLHAQDRDGGAQAPCRPPRGALLGAAAAARARRHDRPDRLRALPARDGRRPRVRRDARGEGEGPRAAAPARAARRARAGARARPGPAPPDALARQTPPPWTPSTGATARSCTPPS